MTVNFVQVATIFYDTMYNYFCDVSFNVYTLHYNNDDMMTSDHFSRYHKADFSLIESIRIDILKRIDHR